MVHLKLSVEPAKQHSGLAHIHGLGFIHKDLKPDNVLIDRDGHCVIADLGGCDIFPGISPTESVSGRDPGVITPEFAAPELYQRDDKTKRITYTQAVDLWSLGATLCELITHDLPKQLGRPGESEEDAYSLKALGLEPDNIFATLKSFACPDGIVEVVMEVRSTIFRASQAPKWLSSAV